MVILTVNKKRLIDIFLAFLRYRDNRLKITCESFSRRLVFLVMLSY